MTASSTIEKGPILKGPEHLPSAEIKNVLVFLHGYGADGHDLISLADFFAPIFPHTAFLSPDAPFPCGVMPVGREWFPLEKRTLEERQKGVQQAAPLLEAYVQEQQTRFNLPASKIAILGFSQGAMMALHQGLYGSAELAAILAFSGLLVEGASSAVRPQNKPPVFLVHGMADEVVPFEAFTQTQKVLRALEVPLKTEAVPGLGHGISPETLSQAAHFLKTQGFL